MSSGLNDGRLSTVESKCAILETRLGYSETRLEKIDNRNDLIAERLTRLEEKITHLPTKEQVVKIALGTLAALSAIILFQSKIQSLIGVGVSH